MKAHPGRYSLLLILCLFPAIESHAQYAAQRSGETVELSDKGHGLAVSIDPSLGDIVFEMKVKGESILRFPYTSLDEFRAHPNVAGIPFLGPWANRLDEQAFYANGKKYTFNMSLGNVRGAIPIHGFLTAAPDWEVVELKADKDSAWLTCRLDFYRHPDWMAQFPFAHTIEITHRLRNGVLEVHTRLTNLSTEPMPVAIGFHPYYRLTDSKRDDWKIKVGAKSHYLLQPNKIPTGETEPIANRLTDPENAALKDYDLDDVFGDLVRDQQGRATLAAEGKHQRIEVEFGPNYQAAVIYSPDPRKLPPVQAGSNARPAQDPNFICFEPMASITDAMNLAHAGKYAGLQSIRPGGTWEESFWVKPSGF
ncbi:MAG TPA: aldose 1-epimerase [Terracidiphilus sp.]